MAANGSQICERPNKVVDVFEMFTGGLNQGAASGLRCFVKLFGSVFSNPDDFVEFIDGSRCRVANISQWFGQLECLFFFEPEITVDDVGRFFNQINVEIPVRIVLVDQVHHFV